MACTARGIIILLLALWAVKAKDSYCGNGLAETEMEAQIRLYQSNSRQLSSIFKEESQLVGHVISFIMSDKQPLLQLYQQLPGQLLSFNSFFVNWLIVVTFIAACSLVAKHFAQRFGCDDNKLSLSFVSSKAIKVAVIAVCLLVLVQGFSGINGALKQQKSLNQMLCNLHKEPTGMLRNSQQRQDFQQFRKELQTIDKQIVKMLKLYEPIIDKLLHSSEAVKIYKLVLPELTKSLNNSNFISELSSSFRDLQTLDKKITQTSISYWHKQCYQAELYSHNLIIAEKIIFKGIENYGLRKNFKRLIDIYTFIVTGFYGLVILTSASLLVWTIRNGEKADILKDQHMHWLQYILVMLIFACICAYLITSIAVPHLHWLRNGAHYATTNSSNFYEQMDLLTKRNSEITEVASFMIPLNKSFIDVYGRKFQNMAKEIDSIVSPYLTKNDTYFYNLLKQSLPNVADEKIRSEVSIMIEQKQVKEPYIAYFNQTVNAHQQIIDTFQLFSIVNGGAFGKIIKQFIEVTCILLINRSVETHETCGNLIALLSCLVFLLWFSIWRQEDTQGKQLQAEQMGEIGVNSDMNLSL